jgi:hypothetical protein
MDRFTSLNPCINSFSLYRYLSLGKVGILALVILLAGNLQAADAGFPGRNVNVIGPPVAGSGQVADTGLRQQNEPSCAVNPANPAQICCGFNDYRGIDIPEIGDAWEGLSCSRNGGHSWNSQLIPGHRADPNYNMNLDFAADPNLVSVPGGLFYNFIAADRDHVGGIYIQRFAWRNKEDGWPLIQVGGPILISKGTNGRFIDKPHMMGFLNDTSNSTVTMSWTDANGEGSRTLPAGNLGMAAAVFVGNDNNDGTKILYWSSEDWGKTWSNPTKLTESTGVNSGINLAANGDNVCAVWRRFDDTSEVSSIMHSCSSDRGKRFGKPKLVYENMCPFDQTTLNGVAPAPKDIVSFRTNAFPVLAGDGQNFYAFWSDRGFAAASGGQAGCTLITAENSFNPSYGRIVYSKTGNNGKSWTAPKTIEDAAEGHQFMPAAFGANGEIVVSWIDNRDDVANILPIDKQMIVDLWKTTDDGGDPVGLYRHTTDIHAARTSKSGNHDFTPSVKVSNYTKGIQRDENGDILGVSQLEFNLVNARLFQKGTAPFIGDYLSVTAQAYNQNSEGKWVNSNSAPTEGSPTFHISWGDNRDVRGNAWGTSDSEGFSTPSPYTPTTGNTVNASLGDGEEVPNSTPAVADPPDNQQISCSAAAVKADRTRDQNIYSAPLYPLATMRSPGAVKVTGTVQRALPVYIENYTSAQKFFRLDIEGQPSDYGNCTGVASFRQYPLPGPDNCGAELTSLWVKVYPRSSAVRTVFQTSLVDDLANIPVSASVCDLDKTNCELVARIRLNQDALELGGNLEQPDFDTLNSILSQELHNPDLLNPDLLNPDLLNLLIKNQLLANPDLLNPDLLNPDLLNPDLLNLVTQNPDLLNPDLLNTMIANPDLLNPDLLNVVVLNPDLLNPDLLNLLIANPDLLNLIVANPDLLNPDLLNSLIANPDLLNPDLLNSSLYALVVANPDLLNPDLLNVELLNPDLLNPDLLNPDLLNAMVENPDLLNPDLLNLAIANPDLLNPDLLNPDLLNPDLLNPDLLNPDLLNPDLLNLMLLNPDLLNPDLLNPDLLNPDLLNPDLLNPDLLNLLVANPDLLNPDLLNPDLLNPDLLNPDLLNAVVSYSELENPDIANADLEQDINSGEVNKNYIDVTWQVRNDGNTTTGYMAQPYIAGPEDHDATQLIVSKPYLRQTTRDCLPVLESDNQVVVNIYNPINREPIINPNPADEEVQGLASYWLAPGEVANVTLRIFGNPDSLHSGRVGMYVNSEACNTESDCEEQPFQITQREYDQAGPLLVPSTITLAGAVEATGPDGGVVVFDTPVATDEGDGGEVPVTCTYESGSLVPLGIGNTNTCTATDSVGNSTSTSFDIDVVDTTEPSITVTVPDEIFPIEAEGVLTTVDYSNWISVSDSVDEYPVYTCSPESGSGFGLGTTLINCTASDASGNSAEATIEVSILDTTQPTLSVPNITVTAEATAPGGAVVEFTVLAEDAVDADLSLSCSPETGSLFSLGTTTVTCTATDASTNAVTESFQVLVEDTTPPELTVPDLTIIAEATGPDGIVITYQSSAVDLVDVSLTISCDAPSGSTFALGDTLVTCTVEDSAGNMTSAQFNVTIQDTTAPVLTVPENMVVEAQSAAGATVQYDTTATDTVDTTLTVSCDSPSGNLFALGDTLVNCSVGDDSGNSASANFTISVTDTTAPILSVPIAGATSAEATGPGGAIVVFDVTATDTVDADPAIVCLPASGSLFPVGSTNVSCTATDDAGVSSTATFDVTVTDNTDPVISLPADMSVEAENASGSMVNFAVTANDVVDGSLAPVCVPGSGSTFPIGITTVNCSTSDSAGNSSSGSFNISVVDSIAPVLTVPGFISAEATSPAGNIVNYDVTVTDAVNVASVECVPGSGSTFSIGSTVVGCSAVDAAGNQALASFVIDIIDSTAPTLSMPADIEQEAVGSTGNIVEFEVTATDVADSAPAVVCSPASGSQFSIGTTTVTCTATDGFNNVGIGSLTVSIVDTSPPTLSVPDNMFVSAQNSTGAVVEFEASATDTADDSVDVNCSPASGSEFAIGTTVVACTATDDAGLTATASFSITVRTDIIWITPIGDDTIHGNGSNLNFRWGYGAGGVTQNSADMIDKPNGTGTAPLELTYRGSSCSASNNDLVDLDAGKSSLRYSSGEWQLNWQTGQSTLIDGSALVNGCYELEIPRAEGNGSSDFKRVILN